jgi:hypothetical protein
MSIFKFQLNNLKNAAMQAGQTTAVALAKGAVYTVGLRDDDLTMDYEELLATKPSPSPYKTGFSSGAVRNNLVISTKDYSLSLEIFDARINVTQENVIVKTPLTGRRGTVKEYIQASDYRFDVVGSLITDVRNAFPLAEMRQFLDIMKSSDVLKIENIFMDAFLAGDGVVMESYSLDQQSQKYVNIINFKLSLVSDEAFNFEIAKTLAEYHNTLDIVIPSSGTTFQMP